MSFVLLGPAVLWELQSQKWCKHVAWRPRKRCVCCFHVSPSVLYFAVLWSKIICAAHHEETNVVSTNHAFHRSLIVDELRNEGLLYPFLSVCCRHPAFPWGLGVFPCLSYLQHWMCLSYFLPRSIQWTNTRESKLSRSPWCMFLFTKIPYHNCQVNPQSSVQPQAPCPFWDSGVLTHSKHTRWTSHKDLLRIPPVAIVRPQTQSKGILVALLWNGTNNGESPWENERQKGLL